MQYIVQSYPILALQPNNSRGDNCKKRKKRFVEFMISKRQGKHELRLTYHLADSVRQKSNAAIYFLPVFLLLLMQGALIGY